MTGSIASRRPNSDSTSANCEMMGITGMIAWCTTRCTSISTVLLSWALLR